MKGAVRKKTRPVADVAHKGSRTHLDSASSPAADEAGDADAPPNSDAPLKGAGLSVAAGEANSASSSSLSSSWNASAGGWAKLPLRCVDMLIVALRPRHPGGIRPACCGSIGRGIVQHLRKVEDAGAVESWAMMYGLYRLWQRASVPCQVLQSAKAAGTGTQGNALR